MAQRKTQVRFSEKDDVTLLREVLASNPFKDKGKWQAVADNLTTTRSNFSVDTRRVRERTHLMLDQLKQKTAEDLRSSGNTEEFDEKIALLEEITELREEEDRNREEEKSKKIAIENKGKEIRKRAMEGMSKDHSEETTLNKRRSSTSVLDYLKCKSEQEVELRREELNIRKEELKLERERFEQEREERRQRMEMESKEKTALFELLQKFINK
ncbi:uncharacterized protein [Haliotis asinina]|uniref:uncharacterized protein n=1 Tax=Haliotis asinina TaxID=109174 RepID=UPI00353227CD